MHTVRRNWSAILGMLGLLHFSVKDQVASWHHFGCKLDDLAYILVVLACPQWCICIKQDKDRHMGYHSCKKFTGHHHIALCHF